MRFYAPNDIKIRVVIDHFAHEMGIAPPDEEGNWVALAERLAELPPEEAAMMKRKWRKLWRKIVKADLNKIGRRGKQRKKKDAKSDVVIGSTRADGISERIKQMYGLGEKHPSQRQLRERKLAVIRHLYQELALPTIKEAEKENKDEQ